MGTFWFTISSGATAAATSSTLPIAARGHTDLLRVAAIDAENPVLHDIRLVDGQVVWAGADLYDARQQAEAIAQRAKCHLLWIRGEWYQDQRQGTPWRERLWAKGTTDAQIVAQIRTCLEAVPGIASVGRISIVRNTAARSVAITFDAVADSGAALGSIAIDVPYTPGTV